MKKILLIMTAFALTNVSCSSGQDEEVAGTGQVAIDYTKAPNDLKGSWKVDYWSYPENPSSLNNNTENYFLLITNESRVSWKAFNSNSNDNAAEYKPWNDGGWNISMSAGQIEIISKPSTIKPGYTEFKIKYNQSGLSSKNSIIFAKKI
jgi:hypothetical protein